MIISAFDRVENCVGKGEIACTSNFSFFQNSFKRLLSQRHQKVSLCGNELTLNSIDIHFNASTTDSFWKHCGKEEIARQEQFLLFQQCFLLNQITVSPFLDIFDIIPLFAAELEEPKIAIWGKGWTNFNVLTHSHSMTPFDALKIYSCRKHCEKRRNCL